VTVTLHADERLGRHVRGRPPGLKCRTLLLRSVGSRLWMT
jgi:hypothetical protein